MCLSKITIFRVQRVGVECNEHIEFSLGAHLGLSRRSLLRVKWVQVKCKGHIEIIEGRE